MPREVTMRTLERKLLQSTRLLGSVLCTKSYCPSAGRRSAGRKRIYVKGESCSVCRQVHENRKLLRDLRLQREEEENSIDRQAARAVRDARKLSPDDPYPKISAIRILRERARLSLKDAKDAVDKILPVRWN